MSDILIRGLEMPKDGFITITVTSDGRVVGNSKKESGRFEYLDNEDIAKAVPVPPHGRLIDADKIPYRKIMLDDDDEFYYGVTQPYIDRMPTIILAEEAD